jgi:hypothetical protein
MPDPYDLSTGGDPYDLSHGGGSSPKYVDPVEAAQRRHQLLANLQRPKTDTIRQASEIELRDLAHREILQQHQNIAQAALAQRQQGLALRESGMEQRFGLQQDALQQRDVHFEASQRRMMAHDAASQAYHQLSTDRETEIDEQGHGLLQSMLHLDGALRRGEISKDQYDEGLLQAGEQFPMGTRHPEAARHYEFAITEADKQNAFALRREATQAAKLGMKYGINAQVDPDTGLPSVAATQAAALQTPKGKLEALGMMNREMAAKYGVTTGVGSLFNPVAPHTSDDEGKTINLPYLDQKTGTVGKLPVPMPLFDQMKTDFNDRYFALNPQAQAAGAAQPTSQTPAPAATIKMKAPNGMVRDVSPDMVEHFTKLGATVEQ